MYLVTIGRTVPPKFALFAAPMTFFLTSFACASSSFCSRFAFSSGVSFLSLSLSLSSFDFFFFFFFSDDSSDDELFLFFDSFFPFFPFFFFAFS